MRPKGVIFSGGPASVTAEGSPRAPQAVFDSGVPILGICYGQQTLCVQLGGTVEGGHAAEFGRADVEIKKASPLFEGFWDVGGRYPVWMSHGDRVTQLRTASRSSPPPKMPPLRSRPMKAGAITPPCSTPKWCIRLTAPSSSPISCTRSSG